MTKTKERRLVRTSVLGEKLARPTKGGRNIPCIKLISVPYVGSGLGTATPGSALPTPGKPQRLKYVTTWRKPRRNSALRDDSSF